MNRKLYRSTTNRKILGVCGGLAEYLQVDATLLRLLWALFTLAGGAGVFGYIIAAIAMSDAPEEQ